MADISPLELFITSVKLPKEPLKNLIDIDSEEAAATVDFKSLIPGEFEMVVKNLIYKFVQLKDEQSVPLICVTLDTIMVLSKTDRCEFALIHSLIEDLFEIKTTSWCENFWSYLVSRESHITFNLNGSRSPGTTLIRLCNSLVRRLSKNHDGEFSGQIAMYLARAFPMSEKSGLNAKGSFNVENVTLYEAEVEKKDGGDVVMADQDDSERMDTDDDAAVREGTPGIQSRLLAQSQQPQTPKSTAPSSRSTPSPEDTMYNEFWSLQEILSNPTILFTNEQKMLDFRRKVRKIIQLFKTTDERKSGGGDKKRKRGGVVNSTAVGSAVVGVDTIMTDADVVSSNGNSVPNASTSSSSSDIFVPKWLTKRDLFDLQLRDSSFRRSFLVQLYIISDFFLSLTIRAKEKWPSPNQGGNKNVRFYYNLKSPERKYFSDLNKDIRQLIIKNTSSKSDLDNLFDKTLTIAIFRDHNWQSWKLHSCHSFEKPPLDESLYQGIEDEMLIKQQPRRRFWHAMGTAPLSKAWKTETGLDKLKNPQRYKIPNAEEYYERINKLKNKSEEPEESNSASIEEEIFSFTWRGLRAARDQGLWSKFNNISKEKGFSGIFEDPLPTTATISNKSSTSTPEPSSVKANGESQLPVIEESEPLPKHLRTS